MTIKRSIISLALGLALLSADAAPTWAQPQIVGASAALPLSSGGRFAAFAVSGRTIRVVDALTATSYDESVPATCLDPITLEDVGGGQALATCEAWREYGREGTPILLDLATRTWQEPAGAAVFLSRLRQDMFAHFDTIGAQWLAGEWAGYHDYSRIFLGMRLQQCGSTARGLLLDSSGDPAAQQLSDGYATWLTSRPNPRISAYLPECGIRFAWPIRDPVTVVHTTRSIVTATSPGGVYRPPFRIVQQARPACPVLTRRSAVTVFSGGAQNYAQLLDAAWPTSSDGSLTLLTTVSQTSGAVRSGRGRARVQTTMPLRHLRWRLGAGAWHAGSGRGRYWRLGRLARGPLMIGVRTHDGATARYRSTVR